MQQKTPSAAPAPTSTPTPVSMASEADRTARIYAALWGRFANVKALPANSMFSYEAICTKCGWHSMQHDKKAADDMMSAHLPVHWRDVAQSV